MFRRAARIFLCVLLIAVVTVGFTGATRADLALNVTNQGTVGFNGNWTLGYEFTVNTDMEVTHLGFFDRDADGLAEAHDVAIWDTAGNLLVTTSVGTSDPLTGFFRYAPVTSVILSAGQNYVIGSCDFVPDDAVRSDLGGLTLTTSPDISIVTGRWVTSGSIAFPTNQVNAAIYYPTASFQFTSLNGVPEPGSLAILALLGGPGLRLGRRR